MGPKLHEFSVMLHRDDPMMPWGFRLVGGSDLDTPLIVTKVGVVLVFYKHHPVGLERGLCVLVIVSCFIGATAVNKHIHLCNTHLAFGYINGPRLLFVHLKMKVEFSPFLRRCELN